MAPNGVRLTTEDQTSISVTNYKNSDDVGFMINSVRPIAEREVSMLNSGERVITKTRIENGMLHTSISYSEEAMELIVSAYFRHKQRE